MSWNRRLLSLLAFFLIASPVLAGTSYIPIPQTGGSHRVRVAYVREDGAPTRWTVRFTPDGVVDATEHEEIRIANDGSNKPGVFEATSYVEGGAGRSGLLVIDSPAGLRPTVASLEIKIGAGIASWRLPVLGEGDFFAPDTTAYLHFLGRGVDGVSTIQVTNPSDDAVAHCTIRLFRQNGAALGAPLAVDVLPLSAETVPALRGVRPNRVRAEVSCDQRFYALSSRNPADRLRLRLSYPHEELLLPQVEDPEAGLSVPGIFLRVSRDNGARAFQIPLEPGVAYRRVVIDYDVRVTTFHNLFDALAGMFHLGGSRFNKTLYFGSFTRGKPSKLFVDVGQSTLEIAHKLDVEYENNATYHVHIEYDADQAAIVYRLSKAGGPLIGEVIGGAFNLDIADRGNPVMLNFGLVGVSDGAYFPPYGWRFLNLEVAAYR